MRRGGSWFDGGLKSKKPSWTGFGADPAARKALSKCEIVCFRPSRHASLSGLDCLNQTQTPDGVAAARPGANCNLAGCRYLAGPSVERADLAVTDVDNS